MEKINKDMSIAQVLGMDQRTAAIMLSFGMHCLGCPISSGESLESACAAHGVDVNELVDQLNLFFEENA
jgi:hybrid cluster-associated redox disulfide protein